MTPAFGQSLDDIASVDVVPGWSMASGAQMAGLRITLAPGWKTYWRAPGDAGIPPRISFDGSDNVAATALMWPVPEVFDQSGMRSIGYSGQVTVPVEIAPDRPGAPVTLSGVLDIGVCADICVPVQMPFAAVLPPDGARHPDIVAALVDRPLTASEAGVTAATCTITPAADGLTMTAQVAMPPAGRREDVVVEAGDPAVWVSEPDVTRTGGMLTAVVDMIHLTEPSFALDRSAVRITVLGSDHAVDVRGCAAG